MKTLKCIMLIDDNADDNFFHQRSIKKASVAEKMVTIQTADEALEYLADRTQPIPDLIFLDINMPGMNGWEFIAEFEKVLGDGAVESYVVVLTTSENPDDRIRASNSSIVKAFRTKPLTANMIVELVEQLF